MKEITPGQLSQFQLEAMMHRKKLTQQNRL